MFEKLKLFKIQVSDNISATLIGLAVILLLIPSLISRCQFNELEGEYKNGVQQRENQIKQQNKSVDNAITSLGLVDNKLAACLRENLKRFVHHPNAALEKEQLIAKVSNLRCPGRGISNIQGIQGLTRLTTINLNDNNISDLAPLITLSQASTLKLESNPVKSLKPLFSMTALRRVTLPDVSPLNCRDLSAQLAKATFKVTNSSYLQDQCNEGTQRTSKNTSKNLKERLKSKRRVTAEESLKQFTKQFEEDDNYDYLDDY